MGVGMGPPKWWRPPNAGSPPGSPEAEQKWRWSAEWGASSWKEDEECGSPDGITANEDEIMEWELGYLLGRPAPPGGLKDLLVALMMCLSPETPDEDLTWHHFQQWVEAKGGPKSIVEATRLEGQQTEIPLAVKERAAEWVQRINFDSKTSRARLGIGSQFAPRISQFLRKVTQISPVD